MSYVFSVKVNTKERNRHASIGSCHGPRYAPPWAVSRRCCNDRFPLPGVPSSLDTRPEPGGAPWLGAAVLGSYERR